MAGKLLSTCASPACMDAARPCITRCNRSAMLAGCSYAPSTSAHVPALERSERTFQRVVGARVAPLLPTPRRGRTLVRSALPGDQDPLLQSCPVPREQQPVQELKQLQDMLLFDWATMPLPAFAARLGAAWALFMATLGLPVSAVTFDMRSQGVECFVSASIGSLFIVMVVVIRLYLGYAHVGNRLLSATVEYEETGWYDGQIWLKTTEVLMRDRLLGNYTVKPALQRLRYTLVSLAGVMVTSSVLLAALPPPAAQSSLGFPGAQNARVQAAIAAGPNGSGTALGQTGPYWDRVSCYEPWALEGEAGVGQREHGAPGGDDVQACRS